MRLRQFQVLLFFTLFISFTAWNSFAVTWKTESFISSGDYRDVAVGDLNKDGRIDVVAAKDGGLSIKHQAKSWLYGSNGLVGDWQYSFGAYVSVPYPNKNFRGTDTTAFTSDDNYVFDSNETLTANKNTGSGVITWPKSKPPVSTKTEVWEIRCTDSDANNDATDGDAIFSVQAYDPNTAATRNLGTFTLAVTPNVGVGGETQTYTYRFTDSASSVSFIVSTLKITDSNYLPFAVGDTFTFYTIASEVAVGSGKTYNSVAVADVNNDGNPDITGLSTLGVDVWTGNGRGGWTAATTNGMVTGNKLKIGDFNRDGKLDVAIATASGVTAYTGDGSGAVWTVYNTDLPVVGAYNALGIGDYNNDGLVDIIAGKNTQLEVYKNDGDGSWTLASTIGVLAVGTYQVVSVDDLDGDGKLDLVAGISAGVSQPAGIKVYYGNGAGGWTASSSNPTGFDNYYGISIADLNNDGSLDIAGAQDGGGVQVWFGDKTTKVWGSQTSPTVVGGYKAILSGDILNNGIRNLIAAKNGGVDVFSQVNSPLFNSWLTGPTAGGSYQRTEAADIDKDGKLDIVATDNAVGESLGGVHVFYGDGTTRLFAQNVKYPSASDPAGSGTYYGLALGDMNRDGYADIVATSNGIPGGIKVWNYQSGTNSWAAGSVTGLPTSGNHYGVQVKDINSDGYLDIVAGSDSGVKAYQWNSGTSQYDDKSPLNTGSYFDVALTDLNKDGKLDIVAVKSGGISLWLNDGDFSGDDEAKNSSSLPVVTDYTGNGSCTVGVSSGAAYAGIAAGDFDSDGNMDIVAGNNGGCGVQSWFGDGSGKIWRIGYSTEPGPDIDNTGDGGIGFGYPSTSSTHSNLWPIETGSAWSLTQDWTLTGSIVTIESPDFAFSITGETFRAGVGTPHSLVNLLNLTVVPGGSTFHPTDSTDKTPADKFFFRTSKPGVSFSGSYYAVDLADVNHDGYIDVVGASNGEGIGVWFGNGRGGWEQKASPISAGDYNGVKLADFNGDGYLDVIAGHHISGGIGLEVFLNNIDLAPPKVSSTTPANNGSNVAVSDSIVVKFSETIDRTTLNGTNVTVTGSASGSRTVNISYDGTLTIDPTLDFFPKEEITVTLTTGVTDIFGNGLDGNGNGYADGSPTDDYTFKFQTKDTAPAGLQATAGTGQVQLNWDQNRENNFKGYFVYRAASAGGCADYIGSLTQGGACVKLTASPITAINYTDSTVINDTVYYYVVIALDEVPGYPTDVYAGTGNGNYVSGPSNEVSATPTVSKPTVTNIDPGNAATDIAKNKVIDITFSRDMNATVLPAQFSVVGSSKGVYTITAVKIDSKTVRLSHADIFDSLETVTVTVKSEANGGLKDTSGTPVGLAEDYVITFTSQYINIAKTIMVSATPTTVSGDGVSTIDVSAIVQDSNGYTVQAGATVTFTTGSGKFSNNTQTIEALTNASGKATAKITAPAAFQENVTVTASTVSDLFGTLSASTLVNFKPGPPSSITLSASPASIPADGVSTTTITADIKDSGSNSVKDGLYVTLTTTLGKFANGTTTSDPVATSGGKATAVITAGAVTGASTITATVGGATASSAAVLTLTAKPSTITVIASPSTIAADGATTSTITATVKDSGGTNIANGVVINFTTTSGTLSASSAAIAGGAGQATVNLTSTSSNGSASVTASWTDNSTTPATVKSGTVSVTFSSGLPSTVTVTSDKSKVAANNTQLATISATVKDSAGNNVNDGTVVTFTITGTGTLSGATTTVGGIATVNLRSGTPGTVSVKAEATGAAGVKISGTADVTFVASPTQLTVSSSATSVAADGTSSTTITATVSDQYGYPVADGLTVAFTTTAGTLSAATGTTSGGKATAIITATTTLTNSVTVTATCEGVSNTTTIAFKPGPPATIEILSSPSTISANGADTSTITAILKDSGGNLVKNGLYVTLTTTRGTFPNKTQVSDPIATAAGKVTAILTADINKLADGTATITAQIGLLSASYSGLTLKMDNIPPTVATVSPASGNSGVLVNTGIAAVFSEEIDQATLTTTTFTVSGSLSGAVAGSVSYNSSSKTASFTPSINFKDLEVVTVTLTTGVTDLAGNALASNYVWTFTTRDSVPPAGPTGLSAVAGNAQVALSWTANVEADLKGYNVYRTETSGSGYSLVTTGGTVSVTSYTDTGVTNGKTYYYAITAVDTSGNESSKSSEVASSPSNVNPPASPKGLAATAAGTTSIDLTWTANTESNLTGYKIYQSTTSGSLYALVATIGKVTSQQITGLTAGTTYYYVITATDSNGYESSYSTEATARPGLTGDVDGVLVGGKLTVDGSDLIAFAAAFGSSKGDVNYNPYADLNGDGTVSGKDLGILGRNFGRTN